VTASEVDVATETEAVKDAGMFNVVDLDEVSLLAMHHMQTSEFANIGAGVGGDEKEEQWYAAWANECKRIQAGRRTAFRWHNNQLTSYKFSNY